MMVNVIGEIIYIYIIDYLNVHGCANWVPPQRRYSLPTDWRLPHPDEGLFFFPVLLRIGTSRGNNGVTNHSGQIIATSHDLGPQKVAEGLRKGNPLISGKSSLVKYNFPYGQKSSLAVSLSLCCLQFLWGGLIPSTHLLLFSVVFVENDPIFLTKCYNTIQHLHRTGL